MMYALTHNPKFWTDRLNAFIAFEPITRMTNWKNDLMNLISEPQNMRALTSLDNKPDTWSVWGPFLNGTQQFCSH